MACQAPGRSRRAKRTKVPCPVAPACRVGLIKKDQGLLARGAPSPWVRSPALLPTGLRMSLADELLATSRRQQKKEGEEAMGRRRSRPSRMCRRRPSWIFPGDSVKSIAKLWDSKMVTEVLGRLTRALLQDGPGL